ncbi:hypothetical protein ACGGAQ_03255 [Micromonospora sp. NPDC047557]|uniref:hypothetical protein n=1 Tax=Micromonospora sp. NPDC047557 TaxID=3364250 RepID=UPI0037246383
MSLDLEPLTGRLGYDTGLPGGVIALPALRQWLLAIPAPTRCVTWCGGSLSAARLDGPAWVIAVRTRPYRHPDLLVRWAVNLGIVDDCDEQPYIDLRLGHRAIEPIAARLGVEVDTLRRRVTRIDVRIAEALAARFLTEVTSPRVREHLAAAAERRQHIPAARVGSARPAAAQVRLAAT